MRPVLCGETVGASPFGGIWENAIPAPKAKQTEPGNYTVTIRAVGYVLDGPKAVEIRAGKDAKADIKLNSVKNILPQLTNAEWLNSAPGTMKDKQNLNSCSGCHTFQRIFMSSYNADEWKQIFPRMDGYANGSQPQRPHYCPQARA